jgi:predicted transcriptional regulator
VVGPPSFQGRPGNTARRAERAQPTGDLMSGSQERARLAHDATANLHHCSARPDIALACASRATICLMSSLTIRTDPEVERALEALTREGLSRSGVARKAILEAERAHRRARLRAEAESLRNDPEDVAASRELAAEMDSLRAW